MKFYLERANNLCLSGLQTQTYNSNAIRTLTALSDPLFYQYHRLGYIGGGDAAARAQLKLAYINSLDAALDTVSISLSTFKSLSDADQLDEKEDLISADIVVFDDLEESHGDFLLQEAIYHLIKDRIQDAKLTVFFSASSMTDLDDRKMLLPLRQLLSAGSTATLLEENKAEEFFFTNDFESLTDIFFPKTGGMNCSEREAAILGEFFLEMANTHLPAAMWYVLLAYRKIPGFHEDTAFELLQTNGMQEFEMLLCELYDENYISEEEFDMLKSKPLFSAAAKYLEQADKETY